tara:strand:+ start:1545 stop:2396 length:852 start_codon:yes stop_codon:yes gene_type:complete
MGSTKITAPERNYGKEYETNLLTQLKHADKLFASEAKYRPKYAELDFETAERLTPRMLSLYKSIAPQLSAMDRQALDDQRRGDIEAIEQYGGRARAAMEAADPESTALKQELNRQAMEELRLGGKLTGSQQRQLRESVRGGQSSRGFGFGINDQAMETLAEMNAMEDRRRGRQAFAQGQLGLSASLGSDPFMSVLGRPGKSFNPAAVLGQAGGYSPGQVFNPESGYAGGLHGQNANMLFGARQHNAQMAADKWGGAMGALGGIGGGLFGAAGQTGGFRSLFGG